MLTVTERMCYINRQTQRGPMLQETGLVFYIYKGFLEMSSSFSCHTKPSVKW